MTRAEFHRTAYRNLGFFPYLFLIYQKRLKHHRPFKVYSKRLKFPVEIRPDTSDFLVFHQTIVFDEYRCVADLEAPQTIIDLGANVGYSSAYFLSRFNNCRVIAVEPDQRNFQQLEENLRPYGDRATMIHAAVWPRSEPLCLKNTGPGEEWGVSVEPSPAGTVKTITMPKLIELAGSSRVSLLKIDIEGAETELFKSDTEWLTQVDNIVIELHGEGAQSVFFSKVDDSKFDFSTCDELTVCLKRTENVSLVAI
jgi:FkbM family methyltransferase